MQHLLDDLALSVESARGLVADALRGGMVRASCDSELTETLVVTGELMRLLEAIQIEAVGEIVRRSDSPERDTRLTTRLGCHDVSELVQRLTRCAPASAARLQRAARAVSVRTSLAGDELPSMLPAMRDALIDGEVGVDGLLAVSAPLEAMGARVDRDAVLLADGVLAAEARGEGPNAAPPACADLLRVQAQAWAAALDQDGAEPREERALRMRGVTIGVARDGLVPVRGNLLPEVAAQFQTIVDATASPRVDGVGGVAFRPSDEVTADRLDDPRTSAQKRHDALATALFAAASSGLLPTIGGAAPTLVVSVRAEDLVTGGGWAHASGCDEPVSTDAARHAGCAGVIQRVVLGDNGRIVRIGTEERIFNRHQRRAIALRDGGCVIPGCGVPAGWCEIHHVTEHAAGGPTHTDNGVLLCWFHHRFLERNGWRVRMNCGVPEVQAPRFLDSTTRWRPVTKSPTRLLDRVVRRT